MFFFAALLTTLLIAFTTMEYIRGGERNKIEKELRDLRRELRETREARDHFWTRAKVLSVLNKGVFEPDYYTETCDRPRVTDPTWYGEGEKDTVAD